jgi:hypothetical protein
LLVTSLLSDYYERIRCVYFTSPTAGHRGVRDGAPAQPRDRGQGTERTTGVNKLVI